MIKKIGFWGAIFAFLLFPKLVLANGAPFPPSNQYVTETDQKAVIVYENNLETLILSVNFKGNPQNFGWVIPVPSKPEVEKSEDELFTSLKNLTTPQTKTESSTVQMLGWGQKSAEPPLRVEVVETTKIDIYDISTVTSESPEDLSKWLTKNDYQIPQKATSIFEEYIKENWYFICVKIDLSKITQTEKNQLKTGHATPLQIKFESEKIIFPLKLTSIISEYESLAPNSDSEISGLTHLPQLSFLIYVLADGKKNVSGFDIKYANWVRKDEIEELATDSQGNSWYQPKTSKMYLTKFYSTLKTSEMSSDLVFSEADSNDPVGVTKTNTFINIILSVIVFALVLIILLLSPIGLIFIILTLIQFITKSRTSQIIAWIFQILDVLATFLVALLIAMLGLESLGRQYSSEAAGYTLSLSWPNIAAISAAFILLIAQILILYWQYKHQKEFNALNKKDNPETKADNIFESQKEK